MVISFRTLLVFAAVVFGATGTALACNQHPPDVAHERWLAQIAQWNKEYDAEQAAKAKAAQDPQARAPRDRVRPEASGAPAAVGRGNDPQVRSLGLQPQSVAPAATDDARRSRRYR